MNQKHLLKYIKHTLENEGDLKVCRKDGKELTLNEVFKKLGRKVDLFQKFFEQKISLLLT